MASLHYLTALTVFVLSTAPLQAAWLKNVPVTVRQPDGTLLQCYATGDEFHYWLHDLAKYTIIQDPATGYFVYALPATGKLLPSPHIAGRVDPLRVGLTRDVNVASSEITRRREVILQKNGLSPAKPFTANVLNNIVVFIRFADESKSIFPDSTTRYDRLYNSDRDGANSVFNYFHEASYGQLSIVSTFFPVAQDSVLSYQDIYPRNYYIRYNVITNPAGYRDDTEGFVREQSLLDSAIRSVVSQIPAELNVDADNNGIVDNVCFVLSGNPGGSENQVMWPHMAEFPPQTIQINGRDVQQYNVQSRDFVLAQSSGGVAVLCHELYHSLGAPDLYHYSHIPPDPIGPWDLMAAPANPPVHMSAYMKYRYSGWITSIPTITVPGKYVLSSLRSIGNNCYKIQSPFSTEYFLIEYRRKIGTFEGSLPGEGVLVYRVNGTRVAANSTGPPDEIYLYRPGGTLTVDGVIDSAAYNGNSGRKSLTDITAPPSFLSTGAFGGLSLIDVGLLGDSVSITIGTKLMPLVIGGSYGNFDIGATSDTVAYTLTNPESVVTSPQCVCQC
jgi:M6 family metalloprotease-like protein